MANEAVIIELMNGGRPIRFTMSGASNYTKGTLMRLIDPRTANPTSEAGGQIFAGILAQDKISGATTCAVYTDGIFDLTCQGAVTLGATVKLSGANQIALAAAADWDTGAAFGRALETGSNGEVIAVRLNY